MTVAHSELCGVAEDGRRFMIIDAGADSNWNDTFTVTMTDPVLGLYWRLNAPYPFDVT